MSASETKNIIKLINNDNNNANKGRTTTNQRYHWGKYHSQGTTIKLHSVVRIVWGVFFQSPSDHRIISEILNIKYRWDSLTNGYSVLRFWTQMVFSIWYFGHNMMPTWTLKKNADILFPRRSVLLLSYFKNTFLHSTRFVRGFKNEKKSRQHPSRK